MAKKILIVDDSETVLMIERMILRKNHYDVVTARDGSEGVAKAIETKPDLIVMDVIMPNMNGFEAVKQLRLQEETRTVPIVMVTAKAEADSMETAYENGCSDYVTKPINSLEFLTKVRNFLDP